MDPTILKLQLHKNEDVSGQKYFYIYMVNPLILNLIIEKLEHHEECSEFEINLFGFLLPPLF